MPADLATPTLSICDYSLLVHLGCTEEERRIPQEVRISVDIDFPETPRAEASDLLSDTICYAEICKCLEEFAKNREFQLVENLAGQCLNLIQQKFTIESIRLHVHKVAPPVPGILGGVKYTCSNRVARG